MSDNNIIHPPPRSRNIPMVKKETVDELDVESHLSKEDQEQATEIAKQILARHRPTYGIPGTDIILVSEPQYNFNIPHDWEVLNAAYDGTVIKDKSYWRNLAVKKATRKEIAKLKHHTKCNKLRNCRTKVVKKK